MSSEDYHRIFIAVPLDPSLYQPIVELEKQIEDAGAHLRWILPGHLHFTLRFLGEITADQVERVQRATREGAVAFQPFRIVLQGIGAFPSLRRAEVVWVGVEEGRETMTALARGVEAALAAGGFPAERRPFAPHLTLARVRERRPSAHLLRALEGSRQVVVGDQQVDHVVVMESRLHPKGARYTPVEEVRLGPILKSS